MVLEVLRAFISSALQEYASGMIRTSLCMLFLFALFSSLVSGAPLETRNVVLVTVDGVRWQEFFNGADQGLLDRKKHRQLMSRVVRESPTESREALMPFFWGTLAKQGMVFGNRSRDSLVKVTNPHKFSYPGYAEILLGEVLPEIDSNDRIYNRRETVLEFVRRELELDVDHVAAYASWDVFKYICVQKEGSVFVSAGRRELGSSAASALMRQIDRLQFECLTPWDSVRHDGFTATLALEHLRIHGPRLLYVAFDETDDWAHDGRYDMVLEGIMLFDRFLSDLWDFLQTSSQYQNQTTLILATDHGRGNTAGDWTDHGDDVPGAEDIWIAVIGPDTADVGEISDSNTIYQNQIAATLLKFLGIDYQEFNPKAGPPISLVFDR